jgi:peptide/nickel transport system substrate-binding protein
LRKGLPTVVALAGALVFPSCTGRANSGTNSSSDAKNQISLRVGIAFPAGTQSPLSSFVDNSLISETLVGVGWDGRPVARLAESWAWSDDRRDLTLHLQPKVKFHDGTPFDASVAAQILESGLSPPLGISYTSVESVKAIDPLTVVVHLNKPEAFLLADLANSNMRRRSSPDIGTGPFRLIKREAQQVHVAAFGDYYRGRPAIDAVEAQTYQDQRTAWAALMRGEINAVNEVSPAGLPFVEQQKASVNTYPFSRPYYLQLVFNTKHPVLSKRAVRQGLSEAVDRQQIIDTALSGRGTVADGPIWPYHWAYSPTQKPYTHNRDAAALRFDSSNQKLVRRGSQEMPSRFRFTCLVVKEDARFEKIALVIQKQLYDLGVDMQVQPVPIRELAGRMQSGDFDAFLLEWTSGRSLSWGYLTWYSKLVPELKMLETGYKAADTVLDRIRHATTDAETRQAASELQQILYDDPPAIFIAWLNVSRAVSTDFNVPYEEGRDVMTGLYQWRPIKH